MSRRVNEQGTIRSVSAYFLVGSTRHKNSKSDVNSLPGTQLAFSGVQESFSDHVVVQRA